MEIGGMPWSSPQGIKDGLGNPMATGGIFPTSGSLITM